MLEKEPDSMAVTMKQDYAASEVYSTTSEAPPAYKMRQANSVKIAKIIAITVVLSSFILGSFILASSYLQAKQSCDQMQALDAVLNKELMLEAMQQELPKAQALMQDNLSADESNLQTIDREESKKRKQEEARKHHKEDSDESGDSEDEDDSSNDGESDESIDMNNRHRVNLPLDLHLTDLASAILRENQKSRMNCIVERRRSEELVDSPPKMVRLPFGMDLTTDPKQQKVTGERIAIFCESGNELKNEDAEPVRQVLIPIPPVRSFGPITHLPQQMGPPQQTIIRQMPRPIFPMPMMNPHHQQPQQSQQQLPPIPAQMMQAPHPDAPMGRPNFHPFLQQLPQIMAAQMQQQSAPQPAMPPRTEVRIHLQRIPIPEIMRPFLPPQIMRNQPEPEQQQQQQQQQQSAPQPQIPQQQEVQIREMPIDMAIHKFPMASSDEMNVADFAAQKFTEQLRSLIARIAESEESEEETDSYRNVPDQEGPSPHSDERELQEQQPPRPTEPEMARQDEQEQQQPEQQVAQQQQPQQQLPEPQPMLPMGRVHYGRSLLTPISLPGKVMETSASEEDAVRPHYVQPRSV
ncbi:putative mediator of RNA polymerase II transcription subunit 26 [Anopheles stephensi]|uniref:putative mediator of RNA polymerase II transcription subunit 26 n=1 Tax=Anopheles stephensi TaxID=30069 RepID=UPI001658A97B|nr:putative mediator of RNA polymerase II transcription subunit 26 [Anopheles stephensi]